ncbi:hypothetical protein HT031_004323 [Scenedesmus sp. PABB004]|nr:hypothetical protein HT031_004323 [Scenedesmus sp. PABB004]
MLPLFLRAGTAPARRAPAAAAAAARRGLSAGGDRGERPAGPGPGPRSRSVQQAAAAGEANVESGPARSPDAPADPAAAAANRGADPDEALRRAPWQADQAMAGRCAARARAAALVRACRAAAATTVCRRRSSYSDESRGPGVGGSFAAHAPHIAGRLAEKAAGAAGAAARAAAGAASALGAAVQAAAGGGADTAAGHGAPRPDDSPVSDADGRAAWGEQAPDANLNTDTRRAGEIDTAGGTADDGMVARKAAGYADAARRVREAEGLPPPGDDGRGAGGAA